MKKRISLQIVLLNIVLFGFFSLAVFSCKPQQNTETVKKIDSTDIFKGMELKGKVIFEKKCVDCHNLDINLKGPALRNVTKRRKADWIENMILNTEQMIKYDPEARKLLDNHVTKMTVEGVSPEDAKNVIQYLKSVETK